MPGQVPEADGSMACAWDESSCLPVDCVVTGQTVLQAVVNFFVIFIGSTFIGSTIALFSALLYKHTKMYEDDFQHIEMVLLVRPVSALAVTGVQPRARRVRVTCPSPAVWVGRCCFRTWRGCWRRRVC
jgi:hypothetical protein